MNKKILQFAVILVLSLTATFGPIIYAQNDGNWWQNSGLGNVTDGFGSGFGFGDNDGNGNQDLNDAATNWAEGIGEDTLTDLFGNTGVGPIPDGEFKLPCPDEFNVVGQNTSARKFILNVVNFGLSFLGLLAVVMIIYAGFLYVSDAGSGSGSEKAKKIIQYAIIGIIIILGSFAIVNTVIQYAGVGGNDSASSVTSSSGFADELLLSECDQAGNLKNYGTITASGPGHIPSTNFNNGILVRNGEEVTFNVEVLDEFGSPETYIWTFGNGIHGGSTEDYTFYTDGWHDIGVIIKNAEGKIIRIFTKVYVGSPVEARFFSSSLRPKSDENVEFNASPSVARIGNIKSYEWTCELEDGLPSAGSSCFAPDTGQRIKNKFYPGAIDAEYKITLRVTSSLSDDIYDEVSEYIKVSNGTSPTPEILSAQATQDPDDDQLFTIKTWVNDPVDNPLENFRFEVWEGGNKLSQKSSTFGVNVIDASGVNPYTAVVDGYYQTFSEITIDLSDHRGRNKDLRFRTIARNTLGGEDVKDYSLNNVNIGLMNNTAPGGWIQTSPAKVGNKHTTFQFFGMGTDNQSDNIRYEWELYESTNFANDITDENNYGWSLLTNLTTRSVNYNFGDNGTYDDDNDPTTPERNIDRKDYLVRLTMKDIFSDDNDPDTYNVYEEIISVSNILPLPVDPQNNPPQIQQQNALGCLTNGQPNFGQSINVVAGDMLTCSPSVSDQENHPLTYQWALYKSTDYNSQTFTSIGPALVQMFDRDFNYDFLAVDTYKLVLTITDIPPIPPYEIGEEESKTVVLDIEVTDAELPTNQAPIIQFVNISPDPSGGLNVYGDETTFTYSVVATDAENDTLEYLWCFIGTVDTGSSTLTCKDQDNNSSPYFAESINPSFRYKNRYDKPTFFDSKSDDTFDPLTNTFDTDSDTHGPDNELNGEEYLIQGTVYVREKNSGHPWSRESENFSVRVGETELSNSAPELKDINCKVNNVTKSTNVSLRGDFQIICDPMIIDDENHPIEYSWTLDNVTDPDNPINIGTFNDISYFAYDFFALPKNADDVTYRLILNASDIPPNPPYDPTISTDLGSKTIFSTPSNQNIFNFTIKPPVAGQDLAPEIQKIIITPDPNQLTNNIIGEKSFTFDVIATDPEGEGLEYEWEFTVGSNSFTLPGKSVTHEFSNTFLGYNTNGIANSETANLTIKVTATEKDDFDDNPNNENDSNAHKSFSLTEKELRNQGYEMSDWQCKVNNASFPTNNKKTSIINLNTNSTDTIGCAPKFRDEDGHDIEMKMRVVKRCSNTWTNQLNTTTRSDYFFSKNANCDIYKFYIDETFDVLPTYYDQTVPAQQKITKTTNDYPILVFKENNVIIDDFEPIIQKIDISPDKSKTSTKDVGIYSINAFAIDDDEEGETLDYQWLLLGTDTTFDTNVNTYFSDYASYLSGTISNPPTFPIIPNNIITYNNKQISIDFFDLMKRYAFKNEFTTPGVPDGESPITYTFVLIVSEQDSDTNNTDYVIYESVPITLSESNPTNSPPEIIEELEDSCKFSGRVPNEIFLGEQIVCNPVIIDAEGHPITIDWTISVDYLDANGDPGTDGTDDETYTFINENNFTYELNQIGNYTLTYAAKDIPPMPPFKISDAKPATSTLSNSNSYTFTVDERDPRDNTAPIIRSIQVYPDQRNQPIKGNTHYSFYVDAYDPEGDALEYEWDFGNGVKKILSPTTFYDYDRNNDPTANEVDLFDDTSGTGGKFLNVNYDGQTGYLDIKVTVRETCNPAIHDRTCSNVLDSDVSTTTNGNTITTPQSVEIKTKEIEPFNTNPVIDNLGPQDGTWHTFPNTNKNFAPTAHDDDGDPLSYKWTINYKLDKDGKSISGSHQNASKTYQTKNINHYFIDEGTYNIRLEVIDDDGNKDSDDHEFHVSQILENDAPYVQSLKNPTINTAIIGEHINLNPQIFDTDYNPKTDTREYQWFVFESNSNELEKPYTTKTNDYESITSQNDLPNLWQKFSTSSGNSTTTPNILAPESLIFDKAYNSFSNNTTKNTFYFDISLRVIDTKNGITREDVRTKKWSIKRPEKNTAPIIQKIDPSTGYNGAVKNSVVSFIPMTFDAQDDTLGYEWTLYDPTGVVATTFDRRNITYTFEQLGDYTIELKAKELYTDEQYNDSKSISVFTVGNRATNNTGPNIFSLGQSPIANQSRLNQLNTFNPLVGDAENDVLLFDWEVKDPTGSVVHSATTKNMFYVFDQLGDYEVTLTVTEDQSTLDVKYGIGLLTAQSDSKTETVTVAAAPTIANDPPEIIHLGLLPNNAGITNQTLFTFNPIVIDPEGDLLTYIWDFGDGINAYYKDTTHKYTQKGNYKATLTVSDGYNTVTDNIQIKVVDPNTPVPHNDPPVITHLTALPGNTGTTEDKFTLFAKATDPDLDPLTYKWEFDTGAQAFNQNTSYQFTDPGTYDATVTVSDGIHQVSRSLTFQIVEPDEPVPPSTVDNLPPIIHGLRPSPGNTGDLRTIFSFHPLVSDPENDPLRYEWHFGNTHRMYSKNVAYRYPMPGNWHTELFVSDGTHTVSKPITIQVVPVGQPIPPSTTTTVYVAQNPSDLDPGDISIATKADLEIQLGDLQAQLGTITAKIENLKEDRDNLVDQKTDAQQQLIILQNQRDQIIDRLEQLNDPGYVQTLIQQAKDSNPLLQEKYAILAQTTDPEERARLLAEIAALEAQIESDVLSEVEKEKNQLTNDLSGIDEQIAALIALIDQLDTDIFNIDKDILDLEGAANKIKGKISELDNTLSGDYLIEGSASGEYSSSGTKFFLYGNLPMETNRAIFVEWESGDGRSFVGQDATLRYPEDGLYNAKLIVTDGISTVSDSIGIKIHPRRIPRRRP